MAETRYGYHRAWGSFYFAVSRTYWAKAWGGGGWPQLQDVAGSKRFTKDGIQYIAKSTPPLDVSSERLGRVNLCPFYDGRSREWMIYPAIRVDILLNCARAFLLTFKRYM